MILLQYVISKIKFQYQNHINIIFGIPKRTLDCDLVWILYLKL